MFFHAGWTSSLIEAIGHFMCGFLWVCLVHAISTISRWNNSYIHKQGYSILCLTTNKINNSIYITV